MTSLARELPATAVTRPYRLRARPTRRVGAAAVAAASSGGLAGLAFAAPWAGAGLGLFMVLGVLAWTQARAGVVADDDGIRAALPRMALGLPCPPLRRVVLRWDDVRAVRLARRGTRIFGPTPADGRILPCDVATLSGDAGEIALRADVFGAAAIRLATRSAAICGLTVEPG